MREPTRRPPVSGPGWNERAAVALLVLVAGHLFAVEPPAVAGPSPPTAWPASSPPTTSPRSWPSARGARAIRCATAPTNCAVSSAPARPRSTSVSSPASPSPPPSSASPWPRPPVRPVSTSPRWPPESRPRASVGMQYRPLATSLSSTGMIGSVLHVLRATSRGILHPPSLLYPGVAAPARAAPPDRRPTCPPRAERTGAHGEHEGARGSRAHGRSRKVTMTTPPVVDDPVTLFW